MLEMEILEAELLVMTRPRILTWEPVEGRLLQQGQVNVVIESDNTCFHGGILVIVENSSLQIEIKSRGGI